MTYDYEFINTYNGTRSPNGTVEYDLTTSYFARCLYQRLMSVINFELPETWNKQYFINVLFRNGFISVINTDKYGIIPQICTLYGYGLYMQPTNVLVKQPLVDFDGVIGENCELIKLTPDYRGVGDIVEHYAIQLSKIYTSIKVSLENSRLTAILAAKDKQSAETLKVVAEKISSGDPVIIVDKLLKSDMDNNDPIWSMSYDVKNNYITDKLLTDMQTIINMFDREIGIPVVDDKKERMLSDEIGALTADSSARIRTWISCLDESIENTNALFNLNISFNTILEAIG